MAGVFRSEANARERNRVQHLGDMFERLKSALPIELDMKISKLAILKVGSYIRFEYTNHMTVSAYSAHKDLYVSKMFTHVCNKYCNRMNIRVGVSQSHCCRVEAQLEGPSGDACTLIHDSWFEIFVQAIQVFNPSGFG